MFKVSLTPPLDSSDAAKELVLGPFASVALGGARVLTTMRARARARAWPMRTRTRACSCPRQLCRRCLARPPLPDFTLVWFDHEQSKPIIPFGKGAPEGQCLRRCMSDVFAMTVFQIPLANPQDPLRYHQEPSRPPKTPELSRVTPGEPVPFFPRPAARTSRDVGRLSIRPRTEDFVEGESLSNLCRRPWSCSRCR
jgi:hypothetical protein